MPRVLPFFAVADGGWEQTVCTELNVPWLGSSGPGGCHSVEDQAGSQANLLAVSLEIERLAAGQAQQLQV